ncbi:hypothetical protein ARTSIC4J27_4035 [Pseudarthrobacter siccitolerans]|uniref:Uncharacterized protein n=1 Tax=Pseudarthrobacter siccitolerans TaxID=861266 RepID=A0A024H7U7_9MICC|nr:hypothetical protein ARTSIC4J27_4035 [Pseudarthrobacter siccitolerans]
MGEGSFHVEVLLVTGCCRFGAGPVTTVRHFIYLGKASFSISTIRPTDTFREGGRSLT